jgi:tripartite-type tricarboxylate transporter receptor subunit TctC
MDDLAPVATVCAFNFGLALGPGTPARTLQEFIAWAKANPGKASYGSPGAGTGMHFMGVMLGQKAGFEFVHVPYKGGANATTDLLGGTLPALATTLPNLVKLHQSGKLRIVGFTGEKRLPKLPNVPTFREQGFPDIVLSEVFAVFASAKTSSDMLTALEGSVMAAARSATVRQALEKLEFESQVLDGRSTLNNLIASQKAWGPIIQSSGYSISK